MALPALLAAGAALYMGGKMVGKLFGSDPDFTQAWMLNRMTGQGGFFKTFFQDGLSSMFLGSRTASAAYGAMSHMPLGASLYGGPMMYNPYMMNPMAMGAMPYSPLGMGYRAWF
ncbi:hypothetical protein L6R52_31380 [Myxococcota bacterium]|nr:hypothetical protein [Myxococcota bacterium]